jgi:hypothetical protein
MTNNLPMTEHRVNPAVAVIAAIALSAPTPAFTQARFIMVANCLGGKSRIDLPSDPKKPSGRECCNKGCHAAKDRRKKGQQRADSCC